MQTIVAHIADVKEQYDRNYIALQSLHPLRLEEALGLKWKDIDLEANKIHVERVVTHPDRNQPIIKETKTEESRRTLDLVQQIIPYLTIGKPDEFVVGGQPISYQQLKRICKRIQKDMGLDFAITPRRFRTTVLTDLYDTTKDIKQAQTAAGHTTAAMTLKHYVKGRNSTANTAAPVASRYGLA